LGVVCLLPKKDNAFYGEVNVKGVVQRRGVGNVLRRMQEVFLNYIYVFNICF
jgi:hypothetical protein